MATTTKITLSVDSVTLSLAQRAAELSGVSVSGVLCGVQVSDTDPGHVPAVSILLGGTSFWLDAAAGLLAVRRSLLTEQLDAITPDSPASLDARLAAALDH